MYLSWSRGNFMNEAIVIQREEKGRILKEMYSL